MRLRVFDSFYRNLQKFWQDARWAIGLTWSTNSRLFIGIIASHSIQSVLPVLLALASRGLVNSVVAIVNGDEAKTYHGLLLWISLGLMLTIFEALCKSAITLLTQRLKDELNLKITSDILRHAGQLELSQFEDPRFQDIMQRARQNTAVNFSNFVTNTLVAIKSFIQGLSLIVLLVAIEPLIVALFLPITLPYLFYQWRLSKIRYQLRHSRVTKVRWTNYFAARLTAYESVPEIKLLGLAPLFHKNFRTLMSGFRDQDRRLYLRGFLIDAAFAVLSITAAYAALMRIALRVVEKGLTVGDVAIFGGTAIRLRYIIEDTVLAFTSALEQTLYISNLIEFFNITPQIPVNTGLTPSSSRGEIRLMNVTFSYPGSHEPALKNVSLHIQPGETVALVGENGAGKTTLVKLIARLYSPAQGIVSFDNHDVQTLSLEYLHRQISFVFQQFGRYEASVADNIAYGDWQKMLHESQRIEEIARLTGLHEKIRAMPGGYDTMLGRMFGEYTLSGGQWQQIALARAFARNTAKLLILDEPTSNLDARSEYSIFRRFKALAQGRTTILISHRFSTVSMADTIIVMDQGQIVEQGTHQYLLDQGGLYANLYRLHQRQMFIHTP